MEKFQRILDEVASGMTVKDACALLRVRQSELQAYLAANPDKLDEIYAAEAQAVRKYHTNVRDIADEGSLEANKFMLKALRPDVYDPDKRVTVTHEAKSSGAPALAGDARDKIYQYALQLFKSEPKYLEKLQKDLNIPALPEATDEPD